MKRSPKPQLSPRRARLALNRRALPIAAFAAALGVLAPSATAQILYSIDYRGPSNAAPVPCAPGIVGAGDVLSVMLPVPCAVNGPMYGPMPGPDVIIPGGPGGLGLVSVGACIGAPPGGPCPRELDALSTGMDGLVLPGPIQAGTIVFSVDEFAVGIAGAPLAPTVNGEMPFGDSANDVFEGLVLPPWPMPFPVGVAAVGNTGLVDGDGLVSPTTAHYPGVGLIEPRMPFAGAGARPGDNLDALDIDAAVLGVGGPIFFSLDSGFFDPLYAVPNLGTAAANGFLPGAVLVSLAGVPGVYAAPPLLGLDLIAGPGSDDLDALALFENGLAGYQPSPAPYVWGAGAGMPDMLLFSVRRGSAVIGAIASGPLPLPIQPGDILVPPAAPGLMPQIFIPCEYLGLASPRMMPVVFGDDLDALDSRRVPATGTGICHGDGTLIPCPCGNNGANGNGCANSFNPAGANLTGTGLASVAGDTVALTASGLSGALCIFVQGTVLMPPVFLDDGIWCTGAILRLGSPVVVAGSSTYPTPPQMPVSIKGLLPPAGGTRFYQAFYRNAAMTFCPPATSNRTNGFQIVWGP